MFNGVHHVSKQTGVPVSIDITGGFFQSFILFVCLILVCEIPDINIIRGFSAQLNGSFFSKYIESFFQILRIYIGRTFYGSNSSIFKFHYSHSHILSFQVIMKLLSGLSINLFHFISHHPTKKIDSMNTLIH